MEPEVDYRRIQAGDAAHEIIEQLKARGLWVCDSYDHNESEGCSNPDCFKYNKKGK